MLAIKPQSVGSRSCFLAAKIMNRGGRGPRRPFYRYPNPGYGGGYHDGGGYNFSSDVNVDNTGGAFVYGSGPPPQMHYHQPHYGGGGYRPPFHGFRGGGGGHYPPPHFGFRQRGFRPPNFRGGRFPRQGYRGGRGGPRPPRPRNNDNDEPYYHPSMFEDPWRFLLPQEKTEGKNEEEAPKDTATEETSEGKETEKSGTAEGESEGEKTENTANVTTEEKGDGRTIGDPEPAETVPAASAAAAEKAEDEPVGKQKSECSIVAEPGSNGHVLATEDGEKEAKTETGGEIASSA